MSTIIFFVPKILQKYENKKGNIFLQYSSFFLFRKIFQIWEKIKKSVGHIWSMLLIDGILSTSFFTIYTAFENNPSWDAS